MKKLINFISLALVAVSLFSVAATASAARMYGVCSTSQYINVRSGPSSTYSRVYALRNGEPVQTTGDPNQNGFIKINQPTSGWISSEYLSSSMPSWWKRYGDANMNSSSGEKLKAFQVDLNNALNLGIKEDGVWGDKTMEAVKQLQRKAELTADGIAGTYTKLWTYNLSH